MQPGGFLEEDFQVLMVQRFDQEEEPHKNAQQNSSGKCRELKFYHKTELSPAEFHPKGTDPIAPSGGELNHRTQHPDLLTGASRFPLRNLKFTLGKLSCCFLESTD